MSERAAFVRVMHHHSLSFFPARRATIQRDPLAHDRKKGSGEKNTLRDTEKEMAA